MNSTAGLLTPSRGGYICSLSLGTTGTETTALQPPFSTPFHRKGLVMGAKSPDCSSLVTFAQCQGVGSLSSLNVPFPHAYPWASGVRDSWLSSCFCWSTCFPCTLPPFLWTVTIGILHFLFCGGCIHSFSSHVCLDEARICISDLASESQSRSVYSTSELTSPGKTIPHWNAPKPPYLSKMQHMLLPLYPGLPRTCCNSVPFSLLIQTRSQGSS